MNTEQSSQDLRVFSIIKNKHSAPCIYFYQASIQEFKFNNFDDFVASTSPNYSIKVQVVECSGGTDGTLSATVTDSEIVLLSTALKDADCVVVEKVEGFTPAGLNAAVAKVKKIVSLIL
jgi:hypothetical protein